MIPEALADDCHPNGPRGSPDAANVDVGDLGRSFALTRVRVGRIDLGGIARSAERLPRGGSAPRSYSLARSLTEPNTEGCP